MASRPFRSASAEPDGDVGARARQRIVVAAEVMGQRAAALLVLDQHDLDAVTRQQVDGGLIDARRQHLLGAALQQRDPSAPLALRRETRFRRQGPGAGRLAGASASIALIRRNKVGVADAAFGVGSSAASGRAKPRQHHAGAKQSRAAAEPRPAPRAAAARPSGRR